MLPVKSASIFFFPPSCHRSYFTAKDVPEKSAVRRVRRRCLYRRNRSGLGSGILLGGHGGAERYTRGETSRRGYITYKHSRNAARPIGLVNCRVMNGLVIDFPFR